MPRRQVASFFFRQSLMKVLRASPVSAWVAAVALQVFIFCCCGVSALASLAAGVALRQLLIKALRSSPLRALVVASALQVVILSCCAVAAKPWAHSNRPTINSGIRNIFMTCSPDYCADRRSLHWSVDKACYTYSSVAIRGNSFVAPDPARHFSGLSAVKYWP